MKKIIMSAAVVFTLITPISQAAEEYNDISDLGPIEQPMLDKKDPCTIFMCMTEKLEGSESKECDPVRSYFFSIKKFGRHGFDPWKTLKKREEAMKSCPADISEILDKFGRMRG
ncbi:hypothetical protein [Lonsdalea quercina]|uniref:hypothetical protein n=1 Tax=Lonsdalea quercina TaxID=71657 RepID=UPI0039754F34